MFGAPAAVGGGDWAMAAEVFRKYDADGSGRLDRQELMSALRDLGLLAKVSAGAAGRALAEMDTNGDGVVSWEEFREAFSRLMKLRAAEQRQGRMQRCPPSVPANAATDPRLKAAFQELASWGASKCLSDKADCRTEGLTSRQFQRACAAAFLPVEPAAADVVFTVCRKGSQRLSFPRFLEAVAQIALESGAGLDSLLDSVRATAPISVSACKDVDSKLPLTARASRPKSAGVKGQAHSSSPTGSRPTSPNLLASQASHASPSNHPKFMSSLAYSKLNDRVATLQQLLECGLEGDSIVAHSRKQPDHGDGEFRAQQPAEPAGQAAESLQLNPTFQVGQDGSQEQQLTSTKLELLSLLDQRCEAAEARCAAIVASKAEVTHALLQQVRTAAGVQKEVTAALQGYEERVAALDSKLAEYMQVARQERRDDVALLEGKVAALQRGQEEGMAKVHEALLSIARRVGALAASKCEAEQPQKA